MFTSIRLAGIIKVLILSLGFLFLIFTSAIAQKKSSSKNYKQEPVWIAMMSDTNTNYFDAVKAFDTYWQSRPTPVEEQEIIGQDHGKRREREGFLSGLFISRKEKRQAESDLYAMDYRKFKRWQRLSLPFVQSDGRILGPAERLNIWNTQKQQ